MPRRGRPTRQEIEFIIQNSATMSPEELAKKFDRTVAAIKEIIKDAPARLDKTVTPEEQVRKELRQTAEWNELRRQLTGDELKYFEEKYANWLIQMKEDITPSEETQIFLLLKNEILINRNMVDRRRATSDMARMETMLDDIYRKYPKGSEMSDGDKQMAIDLNEQISGVRASLGAKTIELDKLQGRHGDLMKHLKATRDQRFARVESSKESFIEIMKELMHEEKRLKEGEHMELMRLAAEKEKKRLSVYHQYADGQVDRPFLNADSVSIETVSPESPDAVVPPAVSEADGLANV